jgi:hypothetical protein
MTGARDPSARGLALVLGNARSWAPAAALIDASTRIADLGPHFAEPGAWGVLLLGAGLDEFTLVPYEPEPETLGDVARHHDAWARASEAARAEAPPITLPAAFTKELREHEGRRGSDEGRPRPAGTDKSERPSITAASYAEWDRASPFVAVCWTSAGGDVAAVFRAAGGHHAAASLASIVLHAMRPPTASGTIARAREPIERAHAAALAVLDPGFVAHGAMACIALSPDRVAIANVGGVRVHRVSRGGVDTLTDDGTTWLAGDPPLAITTRAVGIADGFAIDAREITRAPEDVLILATAEVTDALTLGALAALATREPAERIVEEVRRRRPDGTAACVIVRGS